MDNEYSVLNVIKNKYIEYEKYVEDWNKDKAEEANRNHTIQCDYLDVCFIGFMKFIQEEQNDN